MTVGDGEVGYRQAEVDEVVGGSEGSDLTGGGTTSQPVSTMTQKKVIVVATYTS